MSKKRRAKGEGNITQLSDGRFQGRVTVKGVQHVVYGKTKTEAAERLREVVTPKAPVSRMSLGVWVQQWLTLRKGQVSPRTHDLHEQHLRCHILPYLQDVELAGLTTDVVENWITRLADYDVAACLRRKVLDTLGVCLSYAVKRKLIYINPAQLGSRNTCRLKFTP